MASAGIDCLDFSHHISEIFSVDEIIPSAGQGVIALQCRKDDEQINEILQKINHANTYICVQAERNVLKFLEGDCETAIGVISHIDNENIKLKAELFSLDGSKRFYYEASKNIKEAQDLGLEVGENLKRQSLGNYKK